MQNLQNAKQKAFLDVAFAYKSFLRYVAEAQRICTKRVDIVASFNTALCKIIGNTLFDSFIY
jgi:hypothetical protein